ncbi:hypothetical protein OLF94_10765, partial [Streptococcus pneumoniae]|nr:hypothetical protein [Streptococcus pneumoniae]
LMQGQAPTSAELWQPDPKSRSQRPDGILLTDQGPLALEVDAGYPYRVVRQKMRSFTSYEGGIVWATPSPLRSARVQALYPDARVLTVDY